MLAVALPLKLLVLFALTAELLLQLLNLPLLLLNLALRGRKVKLQLVPLAAQLIPLCFFLLVLVAVLVPLAAELEDGAVTLDKAVHNAPGLNKQQVKLSGVGGTGCIGFF